MLSKFRGSLLGVLIGDCCGGVFEGSTLNAASCSILHNYLNKLEGPYFKAPTQSYTDDTAMTKAVANALLKGPVDYQKNVAINFVKEYFKEPNRGYGANVVSIFHQLRGNKFTDLIGPASNQFNGAGSYGNGAAMRIAPIALYGYNQSKSIFFNLIKDTSVITHSNKIGLNGAFLQALAIKNNLSLDPNDNLDVFQYIDKLLADISEIEKEEDEFGIKEEKFYTKQLNQIKRLLSKDFEPTTEEVVTVLGHSVSALYSVPTAIYCFLKTTMPDSNQPNDHSSFRRCLEYTISLGGDTDTITSMALALSGSYYGDTIISPNLIRHCEGSGDIIMLAEELYSLSHADKQQIQNQPIISN